MPMPLKATRTAKPKSVTAKRAGPRKTTKAKAPTKKLAKPPAAPRPTGSKQSQLIALLQAPAGATIAQMTHVTGWQPHTVRGAISGSLRKRLGLQVVCGGEAGAGVYRIVQGA